LKIFPFATGVNDTGGAPLAANISASFKKNLKRPLWYIYLGDWGKLIHEKNQKLKIEPNSYLQSAILIFSLDENNDREKMR
jgi:hypothetical protein